MLKTTTIFKDIYPTKKINISSINVSFLQTNSFGKTNELATPLKGSKGQYNIS